MDVDCTKIIILESRCTPPCSMGWSTFSKKLDENRKRVVIMGNNSNPYFHSKVPEIGKSYMPMDKCILTTDTNDLQQKTGAMFTKCIKTI